MNALYFFALLFLGSISIIEAASRCSAPQAIERIWNERPEVREEMQRLARPRNVEREIDDDSIHRITTVFHILASDKSQNRSILSVTSQLQASNQDFNRLNLDAANTLDEFKSVAGTARIELVLASTDPSGAPTSGVVWHTTSVATFPGVADADFDYDCMNPDKGGVELWDTSRYLNVVVCNIQEDLGYALGPGSPTSIDGVVVTTVGFGLVEATPPYNKGRTMTHELGHWFGLKHTWGDTSGGCDKDDGIQDTPPTAGPNYGCPLDANSCGTTAMVQNYMDYSDDSCMNLFTVDQIQRMRSYLTPGGLRYTAISNYSGPVIGIGGETTNFVDEKLAESPKPSTSLLKGSTLLIVAIVGGIIALVLITVFAAVTTTWAIRRRRRLSVNTESVKTVDTSSSDVVVEVKIEGGV